MLGGAVSRVRRAQPLISASSHVAPSVLFGGVQRPPLLTILGPSHDAAVIPLAPTYKYRTGHARSPEHRHAHKQSTPPAPALRESSRQPLQRGLGGRLKKTCIPGHCRASSLAHHGPWALCRWRRERAELPETHQLLAAVSEDLPAPPLYWQ